MQKIKGAITFWIASEKGKNVLTAIIIILVGVSSYGAGRLSKSSEKAGITIEYPEPLVSVQYSTLANGSTPVEPLSGGAVKGAQSVTKPVLKPQSNVKTYFASSRGNKYYHLGCSGGKTLKKKIKFISIPPRKPNGQGTSYRVRVNKLEIGAPG